jgi:hypothetical protein
MTSDESKLREIIADVRALRESVGIEGLSTAPGLPEIEKSLAAIERKLGGLSKSEKENPPLRYFGEIPM